MDIKTIDKNDPDFPFLLKQINDPPEKIYLSGNLPRENTKVLTVVGARKHTSYGKEVCERLISGLKGYDICIVSGLALGIDSVAHLTALDTGLQTIAFPGSGLDRSVLYPASHIHLSERIVTDGGGLISEYEMTQIATPWTFPRRNRLMAGIAHATLVIEAEIGGGTLITSKHASEYNRDVGAVPGSVFSSLSDGPHMLIRLGAVPIRSSEDILEMLQIKENAYANLDKDVNKISDLNISMEEKRILEIIGHEPCTADKILMDTGFDVKKFNLLVSKLEISGYLVIDDGLFYKK